MRLSPPGSAPFDRRDPAPRTEGTSVPAPPTAVPPRLGPHDGLSGATPPPYARGAVAGRGRVGQLGGVVERVEPGFRVELRSAGRTAGPVEVVGRLPPGTPAHHQSL